MNKPHKHAEVIKAMADGAQAEYQSQFDGKWKAAEGTQSPFSMPIHEWRIKKAPVVRWQWICKRRDGSMYVTSDLDTEDDIRKWADENGYNVIGKAEWTRTEFDE